MHCGTKDSVQAFFFGGGGYIIQLNGFYVAPGQVTVLFCCLWGWGGVGGGSN